MPKLPWSGTSPAIWTGSPTPRNGMPGRDKMTTHTGDAGKRVACGVAGAG